MVRTLYDSSTEKEVIKRINDIPLQAAEEQALSQMETPFFGIWISSGEGYDISVTAIDIPSVPSAGSSSAFSRKQL